MNAFDIVRARAPKWNHLTGLFHLKGLGDIGLQSPFVSPGFCFKLGFMGIRLPPWLLPCNPIFLSTFDFLSAKFDHPFNLGRIWHFEAVGCPKMSREILYLENTIEGTERSTRTAPSATPIDEETDRPAEKRSNGGYDGRAMLQKALELLGKLRRRSKRGAEAGPRTTRSHRAPTPVQTLWASQADTSISNPAQSVTEILHYTIDTSRINDEIAPGAIRALADDEVRTAEDQSN
ncbi:hypothetical protein B0T11DRAFT_298857 [Plectosphaerella cucumerina]|uniref:Uncharacterized protein n=1 Tax=Plectosphaerella cucumerina TaxID=40658 RepID=A0A8K0THA1_9PEZI|nr:hypothetical protein B0T11DRAFT_298857 [Plectosphaerella cucumerina]